MANATKGDTDVLEIAGGESNATLTSCDCSAPSAAAEEPEAVLKVLTIDWKVNDVIDFLGPRFEEFKNGRVKVEATSLSGFDTLFGEIESDARSKVGLFDVCEY